MAAFDTTTTHFGGSFATRLIHRAHSAFEIVAEQKARRDTRKALDSLTDRELDDIGLVRGDILRKF